MQRKEKRLGELLIEKKLIDKSKLEEALEEQKNTKDFLGKILLRKGYIRQEDLLKILAEQFNLEVESLKYTYLDTSLLRNFSTTLILDYRCLPLRKEKNRLVFAITNPLDAWTIKKAEEEILKLADKVVVTSWDHERQLQECHRIQNNKVEVITNGYDEDDFRGMEVYRLYPDKLVITFLGSFYLGYKEQALKLSKAAEEISEKIELVF
ncbi:MAG: hypothetical protein NC903_02645, partial [Candidatus Omnitrophica bacterium]|nr:hypothetical protein [Candidatus Omnitrophota bacterium]